MKKQKPMAKPSLGSLHGKLRPPNEETKTDGEAALGSLHSKLRHPNEETKTDGEAVA